MIPSENQFDVYVAGSVILEVRRGERLSQAQQFGEDWDGPLHSVVHAYAFCPPGVPRARWRSLAWIAFCVAAGLGTGAVFVWGHVARGWW